MWLMKFIQYYVFQAGDDVKVMLDKYVFGMTSVSCSADVGPTVSSLRCRQISGWWVGSGVNITVENSIDLLFAVELSLAVQQSEQHA